MADELSHDFAERVQIPDLKELDIPNEDKYIDITDVFFNLLKHIKDPNVVQSELFDLLEGTRAVEVSNPRLDTGLIPLADEDVKFDTSLPQDLETIIAIQDKLIQSYMSWLNSSTLPITVLSCRYVQVLLENYSTNQEVFSLVNTRLPSQNHDDSIEFHLVHKVLRSFIMGLCKFIDLSLIIARAVLYEDEDLTHRSLGLNFLSLVEIQNIKSEINASIEWVKSKDELKNSPLVYQLLLASTMLDLPVVYESSIKLFSSNKILLRFAMVCVQLIDKLSILEINEQKIPPFTFSKFIQVDLDNNIIPSDLYEIPRDEAWKNLRGIFSSINTLVINASTIRNINQFNNTLQFDVQNKIADFNVLVRGVFQLFLVRDNSTIYGSPDTNLTTLVYHKMENLIGKNTALLRIHLAQLPDEITITLLDQFKNLMSQLESAMYHNLTIPANNPCRQQQLTSRALVIWDSLQVAWESFEQDCFAQHKLGDQMPNGDLGFSISSYIYHTKLQLMVQLALHGIELDLYRDYELYLVYWYTSYLIQISVEHLTGRVSQIIDGKALTLSTFKVKKLKAGPKKEQLKKQHQFNLETVLPELVRVQKYNTTYEVNSLLAQRDLMESIRLYQIVMYSFDLIDYLSGPKNSLTSFETLFNLRLKPWSSIGVPDVPSFSQYKQSLSLTYLKKGATSYEPILKMIEAKLASAREAFQTLVKEITSGSLEQEFLEDKSNVLNWYNGLAKTCIAYAIEIKNVRKIVQGGDFSNVAKDYKLHTDKGYHSYYPIFRMKRKEKT